MLHFTLPDNSELLLPEGSNLVTIAKLAVDRKSPIVEATLNGKPLDLQYPLTEGGKVDFIEMNSEEGMRVYVRTLLNMFLRATYELFPKARLGIRNAVGSALYIADVSAEPLNYRQWRQVEQLMHTYVERQEQFKLHRISRDVALEKAKGFALTDSIDILQRLPQDQPLLVYNFGGQDTYMFGSMCPDASYVPLFEVLPYRHGVVLNYPDVGQYDILPPFQDQPVLQSACEVAEEWSRLVQCNSVPKLNQLIKAGKVQRMIHICEAWQERKLAEIANRVAARKHELKLILIAGPSSSGKTSTAQRLSVELGVVGLSPLPISMDDYYVERVNTPKKPDGSYDYECLEAIDIPLFNEHLQKLLAGAEVELPKYNFKTGKREYHGNKIKMDANSVLIVEGIHGLNERVTATIPARNKLKMYVSALTPMNMNEFNRINTTNVRLLRRLVRDSQFRGKPAEATLNQWVDVRAGEEKNIFPFNGDADVVFNSTLIYELAVLKKYAEPRLQEVQPQAGNAYTMAQKLLALLSYVDSFEDDSVIPNNSIIKEFIGGSVFKEVQ